MIRKIRVPVWEKVRAFIYPYGAFRFIGDDIFIVHEVGSAIAFDIVVYVFCRRKIVCVHVDSSFLMWCGIYHCFFRLGVSRIILPFCVFG